jgi:hypothetical protein
MAEGIRGWLLEWAAFIPGVILVGVLFWISRLVCKPRRRPSERVPLDMALGEPDEAGEAVRCPHGLLRGPFEDHGAL